MQNEENLLGDELLLKIYNDGCFPQEWFKESLETLTAWRKMEKTEQKLEKLLNKDQLELFYELTVDRRELTALLLKDSFLCYLKMGAKLMNSILDK